MRKLNESEVEFCEKVLNKIEKLNIKKFKRISYGLRIFMDDNHTVKMEYISNKRIDISFNEYGHRYYLISGYKENEIKTIKKISLYKNKNKNLFNDVDSFISNIISEMESQEHLEKQRIIKKYFED